MLSFMELVFASCAAMWDCVARVFGSKLVGIWTLPERFESYM
jgi:hypothetical protein